MRNILLVGATALFLMPACSPMGKVEKQISQGPAALATLPVPKGESIRLDNIKLPAYSAQALDQGRETAQGVFDGFAQHFNSSGPPTVDVPMRLSSVAEVKKRGLFSQTLYSDDSQVYFISARGRFIKLMGVGKSKVFLRLSGIFSRDGGLLGLALTDEQAAL